MLLCESLEANPTLRNNQDNMGLQEPHCKFQSKQQLKGTKIQTVLSHSS